MSCRHCRGLHCDGCRDRGGSGAALAGLAVIIALAVPQVWPRIAHAVEIAAWTTAALTGTVITMTAGVWLTRISRRRRARRAAERTAVRRPAGHVAAGTRRMARPAGATMTPGEYCEALAASRHGPHDDATTIGVARLAGESVRFLNYATGPAAAGLAEPATAC